MAALPPLTAMDVSGGIRLNMGAYDDILNLPYPIPTRHPRMPMADRAAQFQPFQALSGYGSAIQETVRVTGERVELTEDEKGVLDEKLRHLFETGEEGVFTYFLPDEKKSGGTYVATMGRIRKIDPLQGCVVLMDGTAISIEDILEIKGEAVQDNPF